MNVSEKDPLIAGFMLPFKQFLFMNETLILIQTESKQTLLLQKIWFCFRINTGFFPKIKLGFISK